MSHTYNNISYRVILHCIIRIYVFNYTIITSAFDFQLQLISDNGERFRDMMEYGTSMAQCNTTVSPLLMHWRYCTLAEIIDIMMVSDEWILVRFVIPIGKSFINLKQIQCHHKYLEWNTRINVDIKQNIFEKIITACFYMTCIMWMVLLSNGLCYGWSHGRCQFITWTNADILSIRSIGTN